MAKRTTLTFSWEEIIKVFLTAAALVLFITSLAGVYYLGFLEGYSRGETTTISLLSDYLEKEAPTPSPLPTTQPTPTQSLQTAITRQANWGGPELWDVVNTRRQELGVNPLSQRDELCTIASIRLNELLELGKLDGHEGFSNMPERRPDLAWIFERYSTIAEFLAVGGETPEETVSLWENTLGHRKLLEGGEFVWGCIYAQNTFAVAITAF